MTARLSGECADGASGGRSLRGLVTISIRPAIPDDLRAAAKLAAALVREHHAYDPQRFMCIEPLEEGYERFLRSQVDREGAVLIVATAAEGPNEAGGGYLFATLEGRDWSDLRDACGKIHDVYVDASARRQGIASRLVEDALTRLTLMGAPRVVLMAAWRNDSARKLFERLGFRSTMVEMTREAVSRT
jgi:ribosomal protein S18 acetylase RimI-like enzyme